MLRKNSRVSGSRRFQAGDAVHEHREERDERGEDDLRLELVAEPDPEERRDRDERYELQHDGEREEALLEDFPVRHEDGADDADDGADDEPDAGGGERVRELIGVVRELFPESLRDDGRRRHDERRRVRDHDEELPEPEEAHQAKDRRTEAAQPRPASFSRPRAGDGPCRRRGRGRAHRVLTPSAGDAGGLRRARTQAPTRPPRCAGAGA